MTRHSDSSAELLERARIYDGSFITLDRDRVRLPNGVEVDIDVVRHPGACVVLPVLDDQRIVMVRQYRHATDGWLLELPAGKLDAGEDPRECALREVEEETGYRAGELVELGFIWPAPGLTDEKIFVFLARDLTLVEQKLEADEVLDVELVPLDVLRSWSASGELVDAKSICALWRASRYLDS